MNFRDYITEARIQKAIFAFKGDERAALKLIDNIQDFVQEQDNVTIETVNTYEGKNAKEQMIYFTGATNYPEKDWDDFVDEVHGQYKKLDFKKYA